MHELSIASSILDAVQAEAARRPGSRVLKVGVRIGELAGVDVDSLSFGFEALVKATDWEPVALEIEYCPRRQRCSRCEKTFEVRNFETACPDCGEASTTCVGGEELDIAYLELEEP